MVPDSSKSAERSPSWTAFFMGSAVTAVAILLYQNRKALVDLIHELRDEYREEENTGRQKERGGIRTILNQAVKGAALDRSSKQLALNEEEQIGFLADIVKQLWPYINIAGSDTIRATAEPMFEQMPGPLSSLHFTKIDLGSVPIRLDNVCVHVVDLESNTLAFDLDLVWDGNCDIRLKADLIGSFGVKSIKMKGRMSILLRPLVPTTSIVKAIQYGFINTPELSLKYSGIARMADLKGIDETITDIIKSSITSMMVLPRRRMYKMDKASDFMQIYKPPLSILRVNIIRGRGFVVEKGLVIDDVPDCYCIVEMGDLKYRTHTVDDQLSPVWNETMDFVMSDHDQCIKIHCWDHDTAPLDADDYLGSAYTSPGQLILSGGTLELPLQEDHRPNGAFVTVGCHVLNFTTDLGSLSASDTNDKSRNKHFCGMLTIFILRAFEIPLSKAETATFVQVTCESSTFTTSTVVDYPGVDCLNPWYDKAFLVPLTHDLVKNGKIPSIRLDLINGTNAILGTIEVLHDEIVNATDHTLVDTRPIGKKGAIIQFQVCLQGIESPKSSLFYSDKQATAAFGESLSQESVSNILENSKVSSSSGLRGTKQSSLRELVQPHVSTTPGDNNLNRESWDSEDDGFEIIDESQPASTEQTQVRVTLVSGRGFQIRKTAFFIPDDVPDIYLNTTYGSNQQVWRTKTVRDNQKPAWNESKNYVLHSHGQIISVGVYDEAEGQKDRSRDVHLGSVRVTVGKVLLDGGVVEKEILSEGKGTGAFIKLKCELVK